MIRQSCILPYPVSYRLPNQPGDPTLNTQHTGSSGLMILRLDSSVVILVIFCLPINLTEMLKARSTHKPHYMP